MQQQDKGESLSELEILKLKQKQDRQHLLEAMQQQQKYQKYQPNYQEHHFIKKQYSETSIPSTNADPLYSNSPTPPMMNHKVSKNSKNEKTSKNYLDNNQLYLANNKTSNNKDYYFKLNEEQERGEDSIRFFVSSEFETLLKLYSIDSYKGAEETRSSIDQGQVHVQRLQAVSEEFWLWQGVFALWEWDQGGKDWEGAQTRGILENDQRKKHKHQADSKQHTHHRRSCQLQAKQWIGHF